MIIDGFDMKYVIGFPMKNNNVLLIKRNKHPWIDKWNGAGGKIERGETPFQAFYREFMEETELDLQKAQESVFAGVVTWDANKEGDLATGMYAFISKLSNKQSIWNNEKMIGEGVIAWKQLKWVVDKSNKNIAENIPYFLPLMLAESKPMRYHCVFKNHTLKGVEALSLTEKFNPDKLNI